MEYKTNLVNRKVPIGVLKTGGTKRNSGGEKAQAVKQITSLPTGRAAITFF